MDVTADAAGENLLGEVDRTVFGLNDGTRCADRVTGDSIEWMPLDNSLFKDLKRCLNWHMILTYDAPDDSPAKFSRRTPRQQDHAIRRLWDPKLQGTDLNAGSPPSDRIRHDIWKESLP